MILPDPYIYTTESTWNCPEGLKEFDREICTGIDMLHEPFDYLIGSSDGKPVKNNLVLFGQPVNKEPSIGIHYEIEFWINTTDLKKGKTYNDTKYLFFGCWPDQPCDRITLLEFSGYHYNYSIGIKETVNQGLRLEGWVSDFVLTWRHDNLKFEKLFLIFRYVGLLITITILIFFFILFKKQQRPFLASEQKWILLMLSAMIIYNNPLYIGQIFQRGGFFTIFDSICASIGQCFMMLYPLVVLGGFISRKITFFSFYLLRIILCVLYSFTYLSMNIYLEIESILDPSRSLQSYPFFRWMVGIMIFLYALWLIFFFYNVARVFVVTKQHPKAIKGRYRVLVGALIIVTVIFQGFVLVQTIMRENRIRMVRVGVVWIANVLVWMMSVWFMPSRSERVTSTQVTGALHPKKGKSSQEMQNSGQLDITGAQLEPQVAQEGFITTVNPLAKGQSGFNLDFEDGFTGDVELDRYE
ncbi:MAG: hypothetical protein EZS28_028976 [Streblomastix strix]|uniref:Wntless-like transmembrane domain-containing protein n=1 Tax=Streblomastix strix TaxID=222440 RepID=A0A5J4UXP1_9EUKA|nr:MAG: hypothetical protein EZS28_028976 [Streblomastix strix]